MKGIFLTALIIWVPVFLSVSGESSHYAQPEKCETVKAKTDTNEWFCIAATDPVTDREHRTAYIYSDSGIFVLACEYDTYAEKWSLDFSVLALKRDKFADNPGSITYRIGSSHETLSDHPADIVIHKGFAWGTGKTVDGFISALSSVDQCKKVTLRITDDHHVARKATFALAGAQGAVHFVRDYCKKMQ